MTAIEDMNYYNDQRTLPAARQPILFTDDGEEIELPMKWVVCGICNGKGKHVNPSIDAGGLSAEMMDDVDFLDDYHAGTYDVTCNGCNGRTTVPAVDWDALTPEQSAAYKSQLQDEADDLACQRSELAMGA